MPALANVVHHFSSDSVRAQTGYSIAFGNPATDLQLAAEVIDGIWYDNFKKRLSSNWRLTHTTVQEGSDSAGFYDSKNGEDGGDALVADSTLLITKIPTLGPQGRLYQPGLNREWVRTDGVFLSSILGAWQEDASDFLTALNTNGTPMVMRRPNGDVHTVIRLLVKPYVGRQSRRILRSRF